MTAAPPDVRAMLDDLAATVPPIDVADGALRTADHRRRRRRVLAAAVIALAGLVTITLPTVVGPLTSGFDAAGDQSRSQQYDPDVVMPWFGVDDLPATLDEPVAMVLSGSGSDQPGGDDLAVTASGRVFRLAGSMWWNATVSPDGHVLVWYDAAEQALASRDLRDGSTFHYSPINAEDLFGSRGTRPVIIEGYQSSWNPDGTRLAVVADGQPVHQPIAVVIDVTDGTEHSVDLTQGDAGTDAPSVTWRDDDTLLVPLGGPGFQTFPVSIEARGLDGSVKERIEIGELPGSGMHFVISPDEAALVSTSTGFPTLRRVDTATGSFADVDCGPCTGTLAAQWTSNRKVVVTPAQVTSGSPVVSEVIDIESGATQAIAALSPREQPRQVIFARDLLQAGPTHDPHTSMWWPGWYLDWITYILIGLAGIGIAITVAIRSRRRRRLTAVRG